jgi:hypothetical protein
MVCSRAFSAAAFYGIGQNFKGLSAVNCLGTVISEFGGNIITSGQIASHAVAGSVIYTLNRGKFGLGFFIAGVTKGLGGTFYLVVRALLQLK